VDGLRALADILVVGAGTIRAENPPLHIRDPARRRQRQAAGRGQELVVVVVSGRGQVPPNARFLSEPAQARILAVPGDLTEEALVHLTPWIMTRELEVFRAGAGAVDIAALVEHLGRRGARTILVEGGGELVAAFLEADLLDELRVTLCPALIGGRDAPTPVDGEGRPLALRRKLRLAEVERAGDELFLRYELEPLAAPDSPGPNVAGA
jgi:riboflavin-specific deaminase-like protein